MPLGAGRLLHLIALVGGDCISLISGRRDRLGGCGGRVEAQGSTAPPRRRRRRRRHHHRVVPSTTVATAAAAAAAAAAAVAAVAIAHIAAVAAVRTAARAAYGVDLLLERFPKRFPILLHLAR